MEHQTDSVLLFSSRLPYNQYFGGVSSMSKEQYLKINGFPNNYWGWGGEDDDIYNRPSGEVGKCRMIRHNRDKQNEPNPQRYRHVQVLDDAQGWDQLPDLQRGAGRETGPVHQDHRGRGETLSGPARPIRDGPELDRCSKDHALSLTLEALNCGSGYVGPGLLDSFCCCTNRLNVMFFFEALRTPL
ncbi:hypothetical protein XENOCAPTIV_017385 [Xenoophorus captivus]|uniref:Galactosyltransferase C-terminal domain-containing protein n=1 Tax=Xenoophorus captivus TaxID=1517983 RepID=A0ABV0QAH5_9TELE